MDKKSIKLKLEMEDETGGTKTAWLNTDSWEITDELGMVLPPGEKVWAQAIQKLTDSKLIDIEYAQFPPNKREKVALANYLYKTGTKTIAGIALRVGVSTSTINRWLATIYKKK